MENLLTGILRFLWHRRFCVIYGKYLINSSMFPAIVLRRHFEKDHLDLKDKPLDFFKWKYNEIFASKKILTTPAKTNEKHSKVDKLPNSYSF